MAPKDADYIEIAHQRAIEKKTHVSFPQLKYPSLRDEGFKDPVQWLTGKALDDGAEGLWRVHDGLYDFGEFIDIHPGGSEWLELTKGTDITEAFESHHIKRIAEKTLKSYYVRDAKTPRNSPFTFKEDGFYKTLKNVIREELEKVPKDISKYSNMIIDGLLITCFVCSALSCWLTDYWAVMTTYIVASQTLAWVVVASHNYIHRRSNWRMYAFNLSLWSYRDFRISHALSHHLYPNTLMDLEVSAFEPLIMWNPRRERPFYADFAIVIQLLSFPFLFILNFVKKFMLNFVRKGFFTAHYRWHDLVGFILPAWMYFVSGASFGHVISTWLWILCTASFIFFNIGSNAAHHHPKIFKDGDQVRDPNPDWGMHELEAVMDRTDIDDNYFKVLTFFGNHALHHMFPTLDHAILKYLNPAFLKHCKEYRANYRANTQLDLILGQIKMTLKTDPSTLDERY